LFFPGTPKDMKSKNNLGLYFKGTSKNSHFDKLSANGYIKNQLVPLVLSLSKNERNHLLELGFGLFKPLLRVDPARRPSPGGIFPSGRRRSRS
jgi:hypothetical protein